MVVEEAVTLTEILEHYSDEEIPVRVNGEPTGEWLVLCLDPRCSRWPEVPPYAKHYHKVAR